MKELNEKEKLPVVVYDTKCKIKVCISDPEVANMRGAKLSMEEYVERLHEKEGKVK